MKNILTATILIVAGHVFMPACLDNFKGENPSPIVNVEPEPVVQDEVKRKGTIEVQLADWCSPCRKFKAAGIIKELEEAGWNIKYVKEIKSRKGNFIYPAFRVVIDGKSKTWTGFSTKAKFYATLKQNMKALGYETS